MALCCRFHHIRKFFFLIYHLNLGGGFGGCHLIIAQKLKHVLYKYLSEKVRWLRGVILRGLKCSYIVCINCYCMSVLKPSILCGVYSSGVSDDG